MATNNQDVDTQSRWKSRYYEALGEIEEREKQWRDAERLLRHLVTRLTLAADSRHQVLNQNLTELRNAVRDGRDVLRLRELIDQISEQVAELDNMRQHSQEQAHPATILLNLMERMQLQDANTREVRQLKKQISQLNTGDDASEVYEQFIELINDALDSVGAVAPAKSRKQKLLDRILQRQEKAQESPVAATETNAAAAGTEAKAEQIPQAVPQKLMAPAVGDLLLQLALRMPDAVKRRINFQALKKHTNRARARKDLIAIIDVIAQHVEAAYQQEPPTIITIDDDSIGAVAQAVSQFFQQLNPPQDLQSRVSELEKFYSERSNDIEGLIHCLNSLAEVVAEICSRLAFQRDELESFFVQLSMRLADLDLGLQKTGTLYTESHQDNLHMDKAVHDEIRGIQDSMQAAGDIAQLKTSIQQRLDAIDRHLLRFHDAEKLRYEQAQQTITELGQKVSELENDSGQLRTRLEETQKQAMRDVLTGIPNRQAYEERLASEIARCKRYGTPLSMVVWDVDKFKAINDNYGHAGGDRVLKVIAESLSTRVRETDFVARYGGEEFVMLLPETTVDDAMRVANKLRSDIEQTPFHFHDKRVEITISAGVAQYHQDELVTSLFERADAALYAAKEAGRNQVKSAEAD
ncbi:MAG: diguanylate cyclase [Gammaproteobacteria bacterium]|nr:diguanylate cyclase [Gammaproteobacteria bacterium]